eukprot:3163770-Pleurochrysis_carterae.AAC.1
MDCVWLVARICFRRLFPHEKEKTRRSHLAAEVSKDAAARRKRQMGSAPSPPADVRRRVSQAAPRSKADRCRRPSTVRPDPIFYAVDVDWPRPEFQSPWSSRC